MKARSKTISVALLCLVMAALSTPGSLLICPECGYENEEAARKCSHCNAAFPDGNDRRGNEADRTPASSTGQSRPVGATFVEEEIKRGLSYLEGGDVETARLFFRNAAAVNVVTGSDRGDGISGRIVSLLERCRVSPASGRRECAVCGGKGRVTPESTSLAGGPAGLGLPTRKCAACGGSGSTTWRGTVDDRKYSRGRATARYNTLQQSRQLVKLGDAWLPAGMAEGLSVRERVQVRRAVAPPCRECLGFGRVDCEKCKGLGRVKCPEKECVKGYVTVENDGGLSKSRIRQTRKCPVCGGNGYVLCRECVGQGSLLCSKCNGSGEREACRRCGGEGIRTCRRCSGSGVYKGATCATCQSSGSVECSSCNGDGRRK